MTAMLKVRGGQRGCKSLTAATNGGVAQWESCRFAPGRCGFDSCRFHQFSSARFGRKVLASEADVSGSSPDGRTMTTDPLDEDARLLSVTWPVRVRLGRE